MLHLAKYRDIAIIIFISEFINNIKINYNNVV